MCYSRNSRLIRYYNDDNCMLKISVLIKTFVRNLKDIFDSFCVFSGRTEEVCTGLSLYVLLC